MFHLPYILLSGYSSPFRGREERKAVTAVTLAYCPLREPLLCGSGSTHTACAGHVRLDKDIDRSLLLEHWASPSVDLVNSEVLELQAGKRTRR